jgi:hypothetical protein
VQATAGALFGKFAVSDSLNTGYDANRTDTSFIGGVNAGYNCQFDRFVFESTALLKERSFDAALPMTAHPRRRTLPLTYSRPRLIASRPFVAEWGSLLIAGFLLQSRRNIPGLCRLAIRDSLRWPPITNWSSIPGTMLIVALCRS